MKFILKSAIFLLALGFVWGCDNHWKATKVTGTVVDKATGNPIDKANVAFYSYSTSFKGDEEYIQTGPSGTFEYKFKASRRLEYFAQASHVEYFRPGEFNYPSTETNLVHTQLMLKAKNDLSLELHSRANIRLTLKPAGKLDTTKRIKVNMPYYDITANNYPLTRKANQHELIYGPVIVSGNTTHTITYFVFQGKDSTKYSSEVYCKQNTLSEVVLNY
ncbi:MAG: hypothetical protein KDC83_10325 [Flavobacteriales bacterium]|nr:hypothetical protein [Flavobacteriales bacterium]